MAYVNKLLASKKAFARTYRSGFLQQQCGHLKMATLVVLGTTWHFEKKDIEK